MHPDAVAAQLSPKQAAELRVYDRICGLPDRRLEAAIAHGFSVLCIGMGGKDLGPDAFRLPELFDPEDAPDDEFDHAGFALATGSRYTPAPRPE